MTEVLSKSRLKRLKVQVGDDWKLYELLKAEWEKNHPEATPEQCTEAVKEISKKVGVRRSDGNENL